MPDCIFTQCIGAGREIPLELLGNFCRKASKPGGQVIEKRYGPVEQLTGLTIGCGDP